MEQPLTASKADLPSPLTAVVEEKTSARETLRNLLRELWADKISLCAFLFLLLVVFTAIFADFIAPFDPNQQSLVHRLQPIGSGDHLLGTDGLGRDVLSRLMYGARSSLLVGILVAGFGVVVGTTLGILAGYFGGRVDTIIMRLLDIQLSFPAVLIALTIVLVLGPNLQNLIIALAIGAWMVHARLARGLTMQLAAGPLIESARAMGATHVWIMTKYILPNIFPPLIHLFVLEVATRMLAESVMSFLGFGVQPPQVSWGLMVASGKDYLSVSPSLVVLPGLAISFTVLSINLVANWGMRVLDPTKSAVRSSWMRAKG